jgi:hypothetical protein
MHRTSTRIADYALRYDMHEMKNAVKKKRAARRLRACTWHAAQCASRHAPEFAERVGPCAFMLMSDNRASLVRPVAVDHRRL